MQHCLQLLQISVLEHREVSSCEKNESASFTWAFRVGGFHSAPFKNARHKVMPFASTTVGLLLTGNTCD
ncbi:hypothetical protein TNCV_4856741 [Trichonephila clavipes]|nr:hypothetical protein TNCV_4856741 [Trichonephila clavipes]